jgi:hypothetical protein
MALKSMSIEKLVALKDQIEAMLSSKVVEQRRALESELANLGRFPGPCAPHILAVRRPARCAAGWARLPALRS